VSDIPLTRVLFSLFIFAGTVLICAPFAYTRLVELSKSSRWALRGIGIFLVLAGAAIWVLSARTESPDAQRILDLLGTEQDESSQDAFALTELSHTSHAVRRAFLREALGSEAAAGKVRVHEQGISVALSRVDYAEAVALYREVLRPKLNAASTGLDASHTLDASPGPVALQECFALLSRWSLVSQVSPEDAARIASGLAERMASEHKTEALEQFSSAIAGLGPRLSHESAHVVATKLFTIVTTGEPTLVYDPIHALTAIAPRLSSDRRRELASALVARLSTERRRPLLKAFAPLLSPLSATLDAKVAGESAALLINRITEEWNPGSLDALVIALRAVAGKVDPAEAQHTSVNLLQHVKLEPDPSVLLPVTQALAAFGDRLPRHVYEEAGEALLRRMRAERKVATLSDLAIGLGVLKDKASANQFEEAASQIVSRFAGEHDMQANAALATAIDAVADDLEAPVAERLSSLLVTRMMEEQNAGSLLYIAVGLESISDEVKGSGAAALVARLIGRLRQERTPHVMRSLAFSVAGFKNTPGNFEPAAELLVARMADENVPNDLRYLASGLYALRDKTSARSFERAASVLASGIETRMDPGSIRSLATSLHALAGKAGPEPFERAASAIVANVNSFAALEPALQKVAAKLRPTKARELASILTARIALEQDPNALRVLGEGLADLPVPSVKAEIGKVLAIPQAPCQASRSPSQLFNPLCSEAAWNALAASAVHSKPRPAANDLEPDFTQLAPDDDDDAPSGLSDDTSPLDFHQLSDALSGLRPAAQKSRGYTGPPWAGIALLISGSLVLVFSARTRAATRGPLPAVDPS
jgi:hypothetical protein